MQAHYLQQWQAYLRYHDLPGDEPARLFIHGLGSAASADFPTIAAHPTLAGRRTVLVDLLGFGFSDRPQSFPYGIEDHAWALADLLDHLGLRGAELVGHSMGGTIGIALAALRPDLASKLVAAEPNLDPAVGTLSKRIAEQREEDFLATGHRALLSDVDQWAKSDPGYASYAGTLRGCDPLALHRSAVSLFRNTRPPARDRLLGLSIPKACLFGERSLPDPDTAALAGAGILVLIVPNAGHAMMVDNPDGFAGAVAQGLGVRTLGR